jgi:hypothetical protein
MNWEDLMRRSIDQPIRRFVFVFLCLTAACGKKESDRLPTIRFTPLAKQTPVHLDTSSVERFVDWVSTMPSSQVGDVKEQIALVKSDSNVLDAVASKLSFRNLESYGRQMIYLSILGEMKNERALSPLQDYLNSRECPVFEERGTDRPVLRAPKTSIFDACAGLKSAAVNMIAYLNSREARAAVLNAIRDHASRTVRLSAINAYLYNNGDSTDAIATVRQYARAEETKFVGIPRLTADSKDFGTLLARFYADHPEERPPQPKQVPAKHHQRKEAPRLSVTPAPGPPRGEAK